MSKNPKLSQRIQPHEATQWVIEAIRAVETSLELSRGEVHRLTRELAEAKARAGFADASLPDGWVAVPVEPTGGMVESGFFALLEAETDDNGALMFSVAEVIYRAMLSARPESPPNGLPSKE